MRSACWLLAGVLGLGFGTLAQADEADGLTLPRLQGRIRLGMADEADTAGLSGSPGSFSKLSGASVLGDYYFGRYGARESDGGGFRATSGVFLGSRFGLWGGPVAASSSPISVERHSFSLLAPPRSAESWSPEASTVPYFGLGYSGTSFSGGWGFSADLGLMALNAGSAVRLGRVFGGGQSLDGLLRELRPSPLFQVGASYTF